MSQIELQASFPEANESQLSAIGNVAVSHYKKCEFPSDYGRVMVKRAAREGTKSRPSDWVFQKCKLGYRGNPRICFRVLKDEIVVIVGERRTWEARDLFCGESGSFTLRRFNSKPGYYSLDPVRTISFNQVFSYFGHGQGSWDINTLTWVSCYKGPYQLNVAPDGWAIRAYHANWTKSNVVGSSRFCVRPSLWFFGFRIFG